MQVLILRLEGILQAYTTTGGADLRTTLLQPSQSAVLGMMAAAFGFGREEEDKWEPLLNFSMSVRLDKPGRIIRDYQVVRGPFTTAEGGIRTMNKVTRRDYLNEGVYTVFLTHPQGADFIKSCAEALQNPVFPFFLGKKACVPSRPVFEAVKNTNDVFKLIEDYPSSITSEPRFKVLVDPNHWRSSVPSTYYLLLDRLLLHPRRTVTRRVYEITVENPSYEVPQKNIDETEEEVGA